MLQCLAVDSVAFLRDDRSDGQALEEVPEVCPGSSQVNCAEYWMALLNWRLLWICGHATGLSEERRGLC
jgi:hypothetical protein